jgi:transcriptional regulator with XRE-family HTH domain
MNRDTVIKKIERIIEERGTQRAAAEFLGVSPQYLTDLLKGRRDPGVKILSKLGLQSRVIYESKTEQVA